MLHAYIVCVILLCSIVSTERSVPCSDGKGGQFQSFHWSSRHGEIQPRPTRRYCNCPRVVQYIPVFP